MPGFGLGGLSDTSGMPGLVAPPPSAPSGRVLHISDLHMVNMDTAEIVASQLIRDIEREPSFGKPHVVIVSGDITDKSRPYDAAKAFMERLCGDFGVPQGKIVVVPGNHDLSRRISQKVYDEAAGRCDIPTLQESAAMWDRFKEFGDFYRHITGQVYPLDPRDQGTLHPLVEHNLIIVGLNSAHQLDHINTTRAGMHGVATGRVIKRLNGLLKQIPPFPINSGLLKLAVWHHPVHSAGEDRIANTQFLDELSQAGFRFGLHGHVHKVSLYHSPPLFSDGRKFDVLGAGSLSAPPDDLRSGYPFQYQMLHVPLQHEKRVVQVHTRCREPDRGSFRPDHRWPAEHPMHARSYYELNV